MLFETSVLAGVLFGVSCYLLLQRSFVRVVFGFIILGQAANIAVLAMSGSPDGRAAPIIGDSAGAMVDPLPQALILTAIVIGLGINAYLVVLLYRMFLDERTTDASEAFEAVRPPEDQP